MESLIVYSNPNMKSHNAGLVHPECPDRLDAILSMIEQEFPDIKMETAYPIREELLTLAHPQNYIDQILDSVPFDDFHALDGDTYLSPQSYKCALLSAGCAVQAVQAVVNNETETSFALCRPPGHHAEYQTAMGFCLFANAFIAARAANVKTLIFDFDVHHGNGTEDLVKRRVNDNFHDIAYVSIHGDGIFPGTGNENSQNILNCPLSNGSNSANFRETVTTIALPFIQSYQPELIIFSAGFDGHESDPLGNLNLQHDDFYWIVEKIKPICNKIASILEGGYNLETLPLSVQQHLKALAKQI